MRIMNKNSGNLIKYTVIVTALLLLLTGCGQSYQKWNGKVYFVLWTGPFGLPFKRNAYEIEGVDYKTFTVLDDGWLAKDKNKVYRWGTGTDTLDAPSFELLDGRFYAKDKYRVYIPKREGFIVIDSADATTFKTLNMYIAKDYHFIFYKGKTVLPEAEVSTFEVMDTDSEVLARDKDYYYYYFGRMDEVEYDSFEILSDCYARDKNRVYYFKGWTYRIMEGADPATFEVFKDKWSIYGAARDKNHYYNADEISTKEKVESMPEKNSRNKFMDWLFD